MKKLEQLFTKHQSWVKRYKEAMSENRVRSVNTCKNKLNLLSSEIKNLHSSPLEIRELIGYCSQIEDYLLVTQLYINGGYKAHAKIVYDSLYDQMNRSFDLIKIGKQMLSYGYSDGYNFFLKASSVANSSQEKYFVEETIQYNAKSFQNVA